MNHPSLSHLARKVFMPGTLMRERYNGFMDLLHYDNIGLEIIADLQEIRQGHESADWARITWLIRRAVKATRRMIQAYEFMSPGAARDILAWHNNLSQTILAGCTIPSPPTDPPYVLPLDGHTLEEQLVGGKAAALSRVMSVPGISVLPGCVATSRAWHLFVEHNDLRFKLDRALQSVRPHDQIKITKLAEYMQNLVLSGEVPESVAVPLREGARACLDQFPGARLIVRSSAVAEDGSSSFAGQYESLADVSPEGLLEGYKRVLAGKYSPNALFYRIHYGFTDMETPMAVLVQPMLDPVTSGVVYTRDPSGDEDELGIYAVTGRGAALMDGKVTPSLCLVSRNDFSCCRGGECCLQEDECTILSRAALVLEDLQGVPQDVEWAFDQAGRLFVLQTRPLTGLSPSSDRDAFRPVTGDPLPLSLVRVAPGTGYGCVHVVSDCTKPGNVPHGSILVVKSLRPELVSIMNRIRGVLAETGSRACHFAAVAREFGIPVLAGPDAARVASMAPAVTLDGTRVLVYPGREEGLLDARHEKELRSTPVLNRLDRIMDRIGVLHLTDAASPDFNLDHCHSLHDVIRLVHEMGVRTMFALVDKTGRGMGRAKNLESELPLSMRIVDLGGGLVRVNKRASVSPKDIFCLPLQELWKGLASPDIFWDSNMPHMDWEEFDRISAGIFGSKSALLASYAVVSKRYMHVLLRFGYHFSVVDSLLAETSKNTYVNFRFKGGGADMGGRLLRLEFISRILGENGFEVAVKGDRLDAHMNRFSIDETRKGLIRLGRVLAMTRLMDMRLDAPEQIEPLVEEFYSG
jgi:pyruvate,water dikinase